MMYSLKSDIALFSVATLAVAAILFPDFSTVKLVATIGQFFAF